MDPLSITAGILAIFDAGGKVGKGLKKLIRLKDAPSAFLALNNEAVDFNCVVQDVHNLLQSCPKELPLPQSIIGALDQARSTSLAVEKLIAYELTTMTSKTGQRVDRSSWLRAEHKIVAMKEGIKDSKVSLAYALSLLSSSSVLQTNIRIQQVHVAVETRQQRIEMALKPFLEGLQAKERSLTVHSRSENLDAQRKPSIIDDQLDSVQTIIEPTSNDDLTNNKPSGALKKHPGAGSVMPSSQSTFKIEKSTCRLTCTCSCHRRKKADKPYLVNAVLGALFSGYQISPWSIETCDSAYCGNKTVRYSYEYAFPRWFTTRTILIAMAYNTNRGPEMCLKVMRLIPATATIFKAVENGKLLLVRHLLAQGKASIADVDEHGHTPLHVAIIKEKTEIVKLLLDAGSDIHYKDREGFTGCSLAWKRVLGIRNWQKSKVIASLPQLFHDRSQLADLGLSALHRAYLGISSLTYDDVLASTPRSGIDAVDGTNRTVLSWACGRGDCFTAVKLLSCGADPDKPDNWGRTSLHWSIYAQNSCCTNLLLTAKAQVNRKAKNGQTAFSMLGYRRLLDATSRNFIRTLAKFGADLESVDGRGCTPLTIASSGDRHVLVSYLLEHGVNVNSRTKPGATALSLAVLNNSHQSLRLILQEPSLDYTGHYVYNYTLLHQAAHYADIETLEILQKAKLGRLDIEATHGDVHRAFTAEQCAQRRRDNNSRMMQGQMRPIDKDPKVWYSAFEALLGSVRDAKGTLSDRMESGSKTLNLAGVAEDQALGLEEVWKDAPELPVDRQPDT